MWTFTECWNEFEFAAWWRHRSLKYVPPLIGVTVPNLVILTAWVYVRIPKTLGPRAALFSWVYGIADPHSTHRTAFSDYTGPDLFCSTVFILNYFSSFLIFWSCGRLSWLNCQLSSARDHHHHDHHHHHVLQTDKIPIAKTRVNYVVDPGKNNI